MADVVGKTIFSDGKGKLFFGYYKTDDGVQFVDYKTWKGLSFKDVSKGDTNKERVIKAILKNQKQFNKKVEFNMWAKQKKRTFEETMDWFIQNGWISNINKGGIKESVNEIQYKDAVAKFNDELIKHPMVKKAAQHYKKTPAEIVKVLQQRLSTKGNRGGDTKEVSIDFKDTDSGITVKHKKSFNESVNEDTKKRFDVDFYNKMGDKQTSHEEIIRGDKFSDVVEAAQKILRAKKYEYAEFYYKDKLLGSIHKSIHKFRPGKDYKSSPISVFESVNESASKEAMGIAALTGTRGSAVQDFIDKNRINSKKLFRALKSANLQGRMNFASALSGKPGNPNEKLTIKLFGESVNEGISVSDERHFGKKGIIIMIDDNGKKVSAIFKDKKNADKYNRNNPSDIKKLLDLAKKTKYPNAIDESVNEAKFGYKDSTSSYINKHNNEYKIAERMNRGNEQKFYDDLQAMEDKIGYPKTMKFISNALRGYKVDMFKDPKIKNPADAQEALFLLSK